MSQLFRSQPRPFLSLLLLVTFLTGATGCASAQLSRLPSQNGSTPLNEPRVTHRHITISASDLTIENRPQLETDIAERLAFGLRELPAESHVTTDVMIALSQESDGVFEELVPLTSKELTFRLTSTIEGKRVETEVKRPFWRDDGGYWGSSREIVVLTGLATASAVSMSFPGMVLAMWAYALWQMTPPEGLTKDAALYLGGIALGGIVGTLLLSLVPALIGVGSLAVMTPIHAAGKKDYFETALADAVDAHAKAIMNAQHARAETEPSKPAASRP